MKLECKIKCANCEPCPMCETEAHTIHTECKRCIGCIVQRYESVVALKDSRIDTNQDKKEIDDWISYVFNNTSPKIKAQYVTNKLINGTLHDQ